MDLKLQLEQADGSLREDTLSVGESGQPLRELLDEEGIALNYRCGGQGLCKGCMVEDPHMGTIRACRVRALEISGPLRIPSASQALAPLHGVTEFQIYASHGTEAHIRDGVGLVIDIGTTTVAASLWDLKISSCDAVASIRNSQDRHGDNIVSRISYSLDKANGLQDLNQALCQDTLQPLIKTLLEDSEREAHEITECLVAANPTMLHILSMDSLEGMAQYPFEIKHLPSRRIVNPLTRLEGLQHMDLLPSMGSFVGSDITSGMIAAGIHQRTTGNELLIDFGTNGEILLRYGDRYLSTATAAGPAFEGGLLNCGTKASVGVVSRIGHAGGEWKLELIGREATRPLGISGAAYIDWIATAFKIGLLNEFGRFDQASPLVEKIRTDDGEESIVCITEELFVSEKDVAELLQAKAAIAAGVRTLLECAGIESAELGQVFISGGFGYHLNLEHVCAIGLLPTLPKERFSVLGNGSLGGSSLILLDPKLKDVAESIAASVQAIELNEQPNFEDHYIDSLKLGWF